MDSIVECPACNTALRIDEIQRNTSVTCPVCHRGFAVTQTGAAVPVAPAVPAPPVPTVVPIAPVEAVPTVAPIVTVAPVPLVVPCAPPATAVPVPPETLADPPELSNEDMVDPAIFPSTGSYRPVRRRKNESAVPATIGLLGFAALIALVGVVIYHLGQEQPEAPARRQSQRATAARTARIQSAPSAQPARRVRTPVRRPTENDAESTDAAAMPEPDDSSSEPAEPEPELPAVPPARQLLESLDQSGTPCATFQFVPQDDLQYEQLQAFALQLSLARAELADDRADEIDKKDRDALVERTTHWLQSMKTAVAKVVSETPERLPRINTLAQHALELAKSSDAARSQIIFYGCVFLRKESDRDFILKLDRKQIYFSVPAASELDRVPEESYRLFFVEKLDSPRRKRMHSPGGGLIGVDFARFVYSFDPQDSAT